MIMVRKGRKPKRIPQETPDSIQGVRLSPDHRMDIEKALAPLLERERQFVLEFFRVLNISEAGRLAGYSEATCRSTIHRTLAKASVSRALETIRGIISTAKVMSPLRRRELLSDNAEQIMSADITDYAECGKDGSYVSVGKESPNRKAIVKLKSRTTEDSAVISEVEIAPRSVGVACIKELNEMDGAYPRKDSHVEVEGLKEFLEFIGNIDGTTMGPPMMRKGKKP